MERKTISILKACELVGVSRRTIYNWLASGKIDYVLRVKVNVDTQPVALALIEAKKESLPPGHGLDQAKGYAECRRHNVQFIFSSNGHQFQPSCCGGD